MTKLFEWIEIPKFKEQNKKQINKLREEYIQFKGYKKDKDGNLPIEQEQDVSENIEQIVDEIIREIDPTYNAKKSNYANQFQQWILNQFQKVSKDFSNISKDLTLYRTQIERYIIYIQKQKEENIDPILSPQITKYKSLNDLIQQLDIFEKENKLEEMKGVDFPNIPPEIEHLIQNGELLKVIEFNKHIMYIPFTEKQSLWLGKDSGWCTAPTYKDRDSHFYKYSYSPLFTIRSKNIYKDNYQIYFNIEKKQIKNNQNQDMNIERFRQDHRDIIDFFIEFIGSKHDHIWDKIIELRKIHLSDKPNDIQKFKNEIKFNELIVQDILKDNPIKELQKSQLQYFVKSNNYNKFTNKIIQDILDKDHNGELQKSQLKNFIKQDKYKSFSNLQLEYINLPLQQVKQNGNQLIFIKNPSEQIQFQQVGENGYQIQFIDDPSEKLQLQQIKSNFYSIKHIKTPTEKVQQLQVKKYSSYVKKTLSTMNPLERIKQFNQNKDQKYIWQFENINNPCENLQLQQVKQNGNLIQYILQKKIEPTQQVIDTQLQGDIDEKTRKLLIKKNLIKEQKKSFKKLLVI